MKIRLTLALCGVVLLSVFFRYYLIMEMPGGLFPDEAANGLDINLMEQGERQPFYERGNGREALFFYVLWGSVKLFGRGAWQHHIISAFFGVLAVIGCFLATRKLFSLFAETEEQKIRADYIALLAAFLLAVSSWHVVLSRTAFRANLIPTFATYTIFFLACTYTATTRAKQYLYSILFGACFALGFYTYIAYRIMVPILAVALLWPIFLDIARHPRFSNVKKFFLPTITAIIAFVIFIYPLAHYFWTHPGSFVGRSGQVSVFNPELNGGNLPGAIVEVARLSILGYFTEGDLNWRHNISGRPFLSPLISPFFGIGLIASLYLALRYFILPHKYTKDWVFFLLTGWFWGMLVPVVTTAEGIPHGLRSIGTIPVAFIITAWGIFITWEQLSVLINRPRTKYLAYTLATLLCIALPIQTYALYFNQAYNSPENFFAFRSDLTQVSDYLLRFGDKTNTYLVLDKFSVQTTDYLTTVNGKDPHDPRNQPYKQVDPENVWELNNLKPGDKIVFTQSSIFDIKKFKQYHPEAQLNIEVRNKFGQAILAVYLIP